MVTPYSNKQTMTNFPISDQYLAWVETKQLEEIEAQQCPDTHPELYGDEYVDAMLQDIYDEVTSQY